MTVSLGELESIVEFVWDSVVNLPYEPEEDDGRPAIATEGAFVLATINVGGTDPYSISLSASYAAAKYAAARMFRSEAASVTLPLVCDAFGEIANVLGGNLKSHMHGDGVIGIPTVRKATSSECEKRESVHQVRFHSGGFDFLVKLGSAAV